MRNLGYQNSRSQIRLVPRRTGLLACIIEPEYRFTVNAKKRAAMTPSEALKSIHTLVEASFALKDDAQRKVLLRGVVVVAQKGLGVAPDGVAECEPNVLTFPTR